MRFIYTSVLGMAAISIASAGQIEIGAGTANGISASGLTASYIGTTTWAEKNYAANLFTTDTMSSSSLGGSTLPTAANGFQQFTDSNNGITFAMDADTGENYWGSPASTTSTVSSITVPADVFAVTSANILLNEYFGAQGSNVSNDTVEFLFNGGAITQSFFLKDGNQIASAHNCGSNGTGTCPAFAGSANSTNTDVAWSASYSEGANSTPFTGTSGNVSLLDLTFNLAPYAGDTLTGIEITDNFNLTNSSRLALSAITVSGANAEEATPEPSTVLLMLAGIGVMAFLGLRRKASV